MRLISSRRSFHCSGVVTFVPSFIVSTAGISVRMGSSLGPGSFPNGAAIGGTGISLGSGPSARAERGRGSGLVERRFPGLATAGDEELRQRMLPQIFDAGYHAIGTQDRTFPVGMHPHIGEELGDGWLAELVVARGDCFVQIEEGNLLRLGDGAGPSGVTIVGPRDFALARCCAARANRRAAWHLWLWCRRCIYAGTSRRCERFGPVRRRIGAFFGFIADTPHRAARPLSLWPNCMTTKSPGLTSASTRSQ